MISSKPQKSDEGESNTLHNNIMSRMALNDNKAGMQGLDKEKINKIIMENTVGSRYYKNEQKREAQVKDRIAKLKIRLQSFTGLQKDAALQKADAIISDIERGRDLSRTIIHIDMDAFYASVEERDMPELKEKPMAVGGMDMLSTSNYVARRYGVRAAMPGFIAMKLCPQLTIVPLNFSKYRQVSKEVQEIYAEYDSNFMAMSLDEAYLDITEHLKNRLLFTEAERSFKYNPELKTDTTSDFGGNTTSSRLFGVSAEEVAQEIRFRIHQKTRLTASAGIAPNTMLAKIGSDLNKPNGQAFIPSSKDYILDFVSDLPIRKVGGIGKVSEQLLSSLDVTKCGDLHAHRAELVLLFSEVSSSFFLRIALGCSSTKLDQESERKSISTERTFNAISNPSEQMLKLRELCESLSADMKKTNVQGKTVTLKTKTVDFELHTKSKSAGISISSADEIYAIAKDLLKQELLQSNNKLSLRLMGVGLSKLEPLSTSNQASIKKFFVKPGTSSTRVDKITTNDHISESTDDVVCEIPQKPESQDEELNDVADEASMPGPSVIKSPAMNDFDVVDQRGENEAQEDVDMRSSPLLICPVCSENNFHNLESLNEHLDECLITESQTPPDPHHESDVDTKEQNKNRKIFPSKKLPELTGIKVDDVNEFVCPICSVAFAAATTTLDYFNTHVDSCLNRRAIKDILKEENNHVAKPPIKPSKRRKLNTKQSNTIDKFFK